MLLTLALGTNSGDRQANIATALKLLEERFGSPVQSGRIIETEAVGFEGPAFLNLAMRYESTLDPMTILKECKEIEAAMGRTDTPEYYSDGRRIYHDRIIDIDILTYGNLTVNKPELKIPHPQIKERKYVNELLKELI